MSDLLKSVKADLTDRRLLPIVAVVAVVLLAAVGYAVLGGGSSSSPEATASAHAPSSPPGIAVSESQSSGPQAIAETTDGNKTQHRGGARDPFAALPGAHKEAAKSASVATVSKSSSTSSSTSSTSTSSSSGSGAGSSASAPSTSSAPSKPSAPAAPKPASKPKTIYAVALQFGTLPAGSTAPSTELKPYTALTKPTPLPSAKERLLEFVGVNVTHQGTSASFAVDGEVILHGSAKCLPSPTQCQVIDLKEGASEQLEYLTPAGTLTIDELRVVSISSDKASTAAVRSAQTAQAHVAQNLLAAGGALRVAGLRFTAAVGVLVSAGHSASAAHASSAHHGR
jgi:hypothetical protein